jgi:hypothetical protein
MRKLFILFIALAGLGSCKKYLDVVPDNIATIDNAFKMRANAEQFLFTCYSYMPDDANYDENPAILGGDEIWHYNQAYRGFLLARGSQTVTDPLLDYWSGETGIASLYNGIRDCNIFQENIGRVRDMTDADKLRWKAEVKVLKAYYHFYLMRMYGPVVLVRTNLPINAGIKEVQVARAPVDECFDYLVQLLDEAAAEDALPVIIESQGTELGRITRPIALALKAKVLVTAASPVFNGNVDYASLANTDGTKLFNATYDAGKWDKAAKACKAAIDLAHQAGHKLYTFALDANSLAVSDTTFVKMSCRNVVTAKWNPENIWSNPQVLTSDLQLWAQARLDASLAGASTTGSGLAPTLKMAELFYTHNGVPIDEDKTWDYEGRYGLRTATMADQYYIQPNYQTAALHFDREPRFYGALAFDGAVWFGQGKLTEAAPWYVQAKLGQYSGGQNGGAKYSVTGYWPQKLVNYQSVYSATVNYQVVNYPWPLIRLADLYLMYAEALNESAGPSEEAFSYLNLIRDRAGLPTIQDAWTNYSITPTKYQSKDGLRKIIHQERGIELSFESSRFWDLRRWKEAGRELNKYIMGWDISQSDAATYYRPRQLYQQEFRQRDYFWPLKEFDLIVNKQLVQNTGW